MKTISIIVFLFLSLAIADSELGLVSAKPQNKWQNSTKSITDEVQAMITHQGDKAGLYWPILDDSLEKKLTTKDQLKRTVYKYTQILATKDLITRTDLLEQAYIIRAYCLDELGRYSEAEKDLLAAEKLNVFSAPEDPIEMAIEKGTNWRSFEPEVSRDDPDSYQQRGDLRLRYHDFDGAISDYRDCFKLYDYPCKQVEGRDIAGCKEHLAKQIAHAFFKKGDYKRCILQCTKFIPNPCRYFYKFKDRYSIEEIALLRGEAKMKLGDLKGALNDFNLFIYIDPSDALGYDQKAEALFQLGRYKETIKYCIKALNCDRSSVRQEKRNAHAYLYEGTAKWLLGDMRGALRSYRDLLQWAGWKDPLAPKAVLLASQAYLKLSDNKACNNILKAGEYRLSNHDRQYVPLLYLQGKVPLSMVEASIKDSETKSWLHLTIALKQLASGNLAKAKSFFLWLLDHGTPRSIEASLAKYELHHMPKTTGH